MPDHPTLLRPPLSNQTRPPRAERFDQYEVQREVAALLDSLLSDECRQVMAALGERYQLHITDKSSVPQGQRPGYRRKRRYP